MSKNVFTLLNSEDCFWVYLCQLKYGPFNYWNTKLLRNVSSFFFCDLCLAASKIKSNYWIKECNPNQTDFLLNPWFSDILLAFKPMFLNMSLHLENVSVEDCVSLYHGNYETSRLLFGDNVDWSPSSNGWSNRESKNH